MIARGNGGAPGPDIIASIGGRLRTFDRTATGLVEMVEGDDGYYVVDLGVPQRGTRSQPLKRCLSCGRLQNPDGTLDCGH